MGKPTIEELEEILSGEDRHIVLKPDGSITTGEIKEKSQESSKSTSSELVMFPCPSFSKAGLMCVFASMQDIENKKGLRCRSEACKIRLPLET